MKYNLETGMQSLPFSWGILQREFPEVSPLVKTWQVKVWQVENLAG